jgi:type II secretory pathway component GspD/PulD (secretin)
MSKSKCAKAIFGSIVLCIGLWHGLLQVQPAQAAQDKEVALEVGRENPFADIPKPQIDVVPAVVRSTNSNEESPELFVETVTLKFLDAKNLKQAIDNMSSKHGSIAVNQKNNCLIVCDTKKCLDKIISEIRKADKTPRQIMVEVVIIDVQLGDDTEIGINWDILSDRNYDIAYRQNFTTSRLRSTVEDVSTIGDATAFVTRGLGGDFSVISGTIRNVVHLIQQKRDTEILACPRIMMVSGETASLDAVEELPYTEVMDTAAGGAAALTSTEFKSVGVQLTVSATLTDSNDILLTVEATQNVATGVSNTEIPIVDTRKAKNLSSVERRPDCCPGWSETAGKDQRSRPDSNSRRHPFAWLTVQEHKYHIEKFRADRVPRATHL